MRTIQILLAEDNFGDQQLVAMALRERSDIALSLALDGEQAVQMLTKVGQYAAQARPDLVVLDVNLPKKTGLQVAAFIRSSPLLLDLPIVVFSGGKATSEIETFIRTTGNFFIIKPTAIEKYFTVIQLLANFCRNIVERPADLLKEEVALQSALGQCTH